MTEQDVLNELYEDLMNKVFTLSANYLMSIPKRGFENEWRHYKEMAECLDAMRKRYPEEA